MSPLPLPPDAQARMLMLDELRERSQPSNDRDSSRRPKDAEARRKE